MSGTTKENKTQAEPGAEQSPEEVMNTLGAVVSKVPGRMRVRLKPELRTPEVMAQIQEKLNQHESVNDVTINQRTGSVTVTHDKQQDGHRMFFEALKEAEFLAETALDLPDEEEEEEGGGDRFAKLDQQLADLLYRVDYAIWRKTKLRFRGQILAGTVAGAGVAQMAIYGISLEMLPGPILIWIAWDIYHRVAKEPPFQDEVGVPDAPVDAPGAMGEPGLSTTT